LIEFVKSYGFLILDINENYLVELKLLILLHMI
jgi:hypothetical protein